MSQSPVRPFRAADGDFRWDGVDLQDYKHAGDAPFRRITRQTLFKRDDMRGELRYFEIGPSGHSTLERHRHAHAVVVLRGNGAVLIGDAVHPVKAFDLVVVPPLTWHQFRAAPAAALGFLCMVDAERDKPQLPDDDAIALLCTVPEVAAFLESTGD